MTDSFLTTLPLFPFSLPLPSFPPLIAGSQSSFQESDIWEERMWNKRGCFFFRFRFPKFCLLSLTPTHKICYFLYSFATHIWCVSNVFYLQMCNNRDNGRSCRNCGFSSENTRLKLWKWRSEQERVWNKFYSASHARLASEKSSFTHYSLQQHSIQNPTTVFLCSMLCYSNVSLSFKYFRTTVC